MPNLTSEEIERAIDKVFKDMRVHQQNREAFDKDLARRKELNKDQKRRSTDNGAN